MIGWKKLLSLLLAAALSLNLSPFALAAEEEEEKIPGPELPGLQIGRASCRERVLPRV